MKSFPTFSNENLKFQIQSNTNGRYLYAFVTDKFDFYNVGTLNTTEGYEDYKQWWFNSSTNQVVTSGPLGIFCLYSNISNNLLQALICDETLEAQKWSYDGITILSSSSNSCILDIGTSADLRRPCPNITVQQWSLNWPQGLPSDSTYGIQNYVRGLAFNEILCIDVYGSAFRVGKNLDLYACDAVKGKGLETENGGDKEGDSTPALVQEQQHKAAALSQSHQFAIDEEVLAQSSYKNGIAGLGMKRPINDRVRKGLSLSEYQQRKAAGTL